MYTTLTGGHLSTHVLLNCAIFDISELRVLTRQSFRMTHPFHWLGVKLI